MKRRTSIAAMATALLPCTLASAQVESCTPEAGSCFRAKESPGCEQPECCEFVCVKSGLSECCAVAWDAFCAEYASKNCEPPACPSEGSCFEPHANVGCDDQTCCEFLCTFDGFCCSELWDVLCAQEAAILCGDVPVVIEPPPGATREAETCGERVNDGCNLTPAAFEPVLCGTTVFGTCFGSAPRDTDWFEVSLSQEQQVTMSFVSEFPAQLLILQGECLGELTTLAAAAAEPGEPTECSTCLPAGISYLFVSTGTSVRPIRSSIPCEGDPDEPVGFYGNHYVLTVQCAGCGVLVFGDLNNDGFVDGADLGLLLGNWDQPGLGDLSSDGIVDGADLGLLLGAWST